MPPTRIPISFSVLAPSRLVSLLDPAHTVHLATQPAYEPTEPFVTVEEYLKTSYRPDCEYLDGRVEERNLGEYDHGLLQTLLAALFINNREAWGVRAVTNVRTQVSRSRRELRACCSSKVPMS